MLPSRSAVMACSRRAIFLCTILAKLTLFDIANAAQHSPSVGKGSGSTDAMPTDTPIDPPTGQAQVFFEDIEAFEVYTAGGTPTIHVKVNVWDGGDTGKLFTGRAILPMAGKLQKHEMADIFEKETAYLGNGVKHMIDNVNVRIKQALMESPITIDPCNQTSVDNALAELYSQNKTAPLGSGAMLGVSIAVARACAASKSLHLYEYIKKLAANDAELHVPWPLVTLISGGPHRASAMPFDAIMLNPEGAESFEEAVKMAAQVKNLLFYRIKSLYPSESVVLSPEGGYKISPKAEGIEAVKECLELIMKTLAELGYESKCFIVIDAGATNLVVGADQYTLYLTPFKHVNATGLAHTYASLLQEYPQITMLQDPFHHNFAYQYEEARQIFSTNIACNKLTGTNTSRIAKIDSVNVCDSLVIVPNQVGTLSKAINAANMGKERNWQIIVSTRPIETEDNFAAHLAVGLGARYFSGGGMAGSERVGKYNRLLRISRELFQSRTDRPVRTGDEHESTLSDE